MIRDHMMWTADLDCVRIFNTLTRKMVTIKYPGAALWDLLLQKYPAGKIVDMMAALTKKEKLKAEEFVAATIQDWSEKGFIKPFAPADDNQDVG